MDPNRDAPRSLCTRLYKALDACEALSHTKQDDMISFEWVFYLRLRGLFLSKTFLLLIFCSIPGYSWLTGFQKDQGSLPRLNLTYLFFSIWNSEPLFTGPFAPMMISSFALLRKYEYVFQVKIISTHTRSKVAPQHYAYWFLELLAPNASRIIV